MTVADDEDKANTGEEERVLLEKRELLEDAGYTIAPFDGYSSKLLPGRG